MSVPPRGAHRSRPEAPPAMHHSLDDLLQYVAKGTPPAPVLLGDPDLELTDLVDALSEHYGRPRTLYLDGEADPTVNDRTGAPLLDLLDGLEAEALRAWSFSHKWIGAGTEGGRVFVAVAERVLPTEPYDPTPPGASYAERVVELAGWTMDRTNPVDWAEVEARLGTSLPADYKQLVEVFGAGVFDDWISLDQPHQVVPWSPLGDFRTLHEPKAHSWGLNIEWHDTLDEARAACSRTPGKILLCWASCEHAVFCWHLTGPDPERWPVLALSEDLDTSHPMGASASECLHRLMTDPRAPYSLARHFDRHWFSGPSA
ncbi:hypothetical protein G6045_31540 [Streptomyces sp. YC504]|uniref:SMI1/KNR4 family protein n=1 Tax=Streptomyces mesophilus TaxID=1775132 RepID=A0A6G4XRT9_9ACTN|nr:SMI1/KNR4 family protein [Streptomyces mesophilus]NGO80158.1 hypothetical protein [Streptomyces mesophilus]